MFRLPYFGRFLKGDKHRKADKIKSEKRRGGKSGKKPVLTRHSVFNFVRGSKTPRTRIRKLHGIVYHNKKERKLIKRQFVTENFIQTTH